MPKKRTKKQKVRATYHYAFPATKSFVGLENEISLPVQEANSLSLYQYDPKFLSQDLTKTMVVTLLMIGVEIGLYLFLK